MSTKKATASFKATKEEIETWKTEAKADGLTMSAYLHTVIKGGRSGISFSNKEWKQLITYYKELHKGGINSVMSAIVGVVVNNLDEDGKVVKGKELSVSLPHEQLASLHNFLITFFDFAIQSED